MGCEADDIIVLSIPLITGNLIIIKLFLGGQTRLIGFLVISRSMNVLVFKWLTINYEKYSLVDSC